MLDILKSDIVFEGKDTYRWKQSIKVYLIVLEFKLD